MTAGIRVSAQTTTTPPALDGAFKRLLDSVSRRRARRLMDPIGQLLETSVIRRFELERGPDGRPWKPSRRPRRRRRGKRGPWYTVAGGQTLTLSGRLRGSITHAAGSDHVDVGTNVVYAAIHQFGSDAGGGKPRGIPARPYLGIDDDDVRAITRLVSRVLDAAT